MKQSTIKMSKECLGDLLKLYHVGLELVNVEDDDEFVVLTVEGENLPDGEFISLTYQKAPNFDVLPRITNIENVINKDVTLDYVIKYLELSMKNEWNAGNYQSAIQDVYDIATGMAISCDLEEILSKEKGK